MVIHRNAANRNAANRNAANQTVICSVRKWGYVAAGGYICQVYILLTAASDLG